MSFCPGRTTLVRSTVWCTSPSARVRTSAGCATPLTEMLSVPSASEPCGEAAASSARSAFMVACVLYQVPTASLLLTRNFTAPAALPG